MKNKYITESNLLVIDIIEKLVVSKSTGRVKTVLYFVLSDNTQIKALHSKVHILCSECGKYTKKLISINKSHLTNDYVCRSCLFSGEKNPMFGKNAFEKYSKDERDAIFSAREERNKNKTIEQKKNESEHKSKAAKELWKRESFRAAHDFRGEKNPMYGQSVKDHMSLEKYELWKQHIRESSYKHKSLEEQQQISNKLRISQLRLKEKDPETYVKLKAKGGKATVRKQIHYKKTKPEIKLEQWFIQNKIDYDYSPIMGSKNECYQFDFIIHNKRILIEVQGNYWHAHPDFYNSDGSNGKKKINDIQQKNINRDKKKKEFALKRNFKLIYIWESEIKNNDFSKLQCIL